MIADTPFDRKLEIIRGKAPFGVHDAAIFVNDTLDLCWASAQQVFGEKASPEVALAIYDRVVTRMEKKPEEAE